MSTKKYKIYFIYKRLVRATQKQYLQPFKTSINILLIFNYKASHCHNIVLFGFHM